MFPGVGGLLVPSPVSRQQICSQFPVVFPAVLQLALRSEQWQPLCPSGSFWVMILGGFSSQNSSMFLSGSDAAESLVMLRIKTLVRRSQPEGVVLSQSAVVVHAAFLEP